MFLLAPAAALSALVSVGLASKSRRPIRSVNMRSTSSSGGRVERSSASRPLSVSRSSCAPMSRGAAAVARFAEVTAVFAYSCARADAGELAPPDCGDDADGTALVPASPAAFTTRTLPADAGFHVPPSVGGERAFVSCSAVSRRGSAGSASCRERFLRPNRVSIAERRESRASPTADLGTRSGSSGRSSMRSPCRALRTGAGHDGSELEVCQAHLAWATWGRPRRGPEKLGCSLLFYRGAGLWVWHSGATRERRAACGRQARRGAAPRRCASPLCLQHPFLQREGVVVHWAPDPTSRLVHAVHRRALERLVLQAARVEDQLHLGPNVRRLQVVRADLLGPPVHCQSAHGAPCVHTYGKSHAAAAHAADAAAPRSRCSGASARGARRSAADSPSSPCSPRFSRSTRSRACGTAA